MGVQKNASYKVHNGVDFDEINFKTIAAQVKTAGGSDVESQLAEMIPTKQGIWTPQLYNGTNGYIAAQTNKGSYWYKVGNIITCLFDIEVSAFDVSWAGAAILLRGLPFTPNKNFVETGSIAFYYGFKIDGTFGVEIVPHPTAQAYWITRANANTNENTLVWGTHVEQYFRLRGKISFMI